MYFGFYFSVMVRTTGKEEENAYPKVLCLKKSPFGRPGKNSFANVARNYFIYRL